MRHAVTLAILLSLIGVTTVEASLVITSPIPACKALDDIGLKAGTWKNYGDEFGCNSPYKEIGSSFPLANNLAYYVDGASNSVTQVKLVLNVNDKSQTKSGHSALLMSSQALSEKITGLPLPQAVKDAITHGKAIRTKVGQTAVEIKRNNWPTGRGYEVHVIFK